MSRDTWRTVSRDIAVERVTGIEPAQSAWKASCHATVRLATQPARRKPEGGADLGGVCTFGSSADDVTTAAGVAPSASSGVRPRRGMRVAGRRFVWSCSAGQRCPGWMRPER
jgi:hypothetical protein